MSSVRIATWNVGWTSSRSRHFDESRSLIEEMRADLLVLTETTLSMVPAGGYLAKGGPDWGYETTPERRKVMLWSKWPVTNVSNEIVEPGGRHVSATVESPIGDLRVHAVCVPWSQAHVSGGRENRKSWQDHHDFLLALRELVCPEAADPVTSDLPLILAGDINQRDQPKPYGSHKVRALWNEILEEANLALATDPEMIDKITVGPDLTSSDSRLYPPEKMSDHHAVSCLLAPA